MNHLGWGLQMTLLDMGLVFGLLALLWGLLTLVLRLDRPAADEPSSATAEAAALPPAPAPLTPAAADAPLDPSLLAAIGVALATHRALRRAEAAPDMRAHWPGSQLHSSRWLASGRALQTQPFSRRNPPR